MDRERRRRDARRRVARQRLFAGVLAGLIVLVVAVVLVQRSASGSPGLDGGGRGAGNRSALVADADPG